VSLLAKKYEFLVIDKDNALKNGRYKKRFNEFAITCLVVVDSLPEMNMTDVRERERITREKTSESIRKKHHALKTDRIEEDIEQTF